MQKYKSTIVFLASAFALIVLITIFMGMGGKDNGVAAPTTKINTTDTYTLADVAAHSTKSNCWTAVNGNVYDVTPFIDSHPGGVEAILNVCGIDATELFGQVH